MKNKDTIADCDTPLILKSGATDLRRQEKTLMNLVQQHYPDGMKNNVFYGFSNTSKTAIKLLKIKTDASVMLVKLKRDAPYPWPEYRENGGYTVTYSGEAKRDFFKQIGYQEGI